MCPIHFDDNLQYSQQTTCNVRTHLHGSQHQAFKVSTSQSFVADSISSLPSTPSHDQVSMSSPHAQQWENARQNELNSCRANAVWSEPMHLPPGHKSANLGFIYALKDSGNPKIPQRFKARLVFRNHKFATQSTWQDSFSPVVDKTSLRLFFTTAARKNLFMRQVDVVTSYLNASMSAEVHIKLPKICGDDPSMVRRLYKALYGHLKARRLWNRDFVGFTSDEGFNATSRDECLFFRPKPYFLLI